MTETDAAPAGPGALGLTRFYNSHIGVAPDNAPTGFGVNWRSSYHRALRVGGYFATRFLPDGSIERFASNGSEWGPAAGGQSQLTSTAGGGWTVRSDDHEIETYDASGRLLSLTRPTGHVLTMAYDGSGRLSTVSDAFGRSVTFAYDGNRIGSVTDAAGLVHLYEYDEFDNIVSVTNPGGAERAYKYAYMTGEGGESLPTFGRNLLTGIVDESGVRMATYTYDASERVASSEHAGGVGRSTFSYVSPVPSTTVTTTVIDALGTARTYEYKKIDANFMQTYRVSSISQPCCGGSTTNTLAYNSAGNISTATDYLGRQTTYVWNSRNLPTTINEAVGTGQARTTTITWHATFNKPTQINEPGRRTDLTYNADGNLLTKTVTDTGSGASRTWTYTYNANKLLASVDGPLAGTGDTTTLTWSASGNLLTITNPAGHVMTYSAHDAVGRPHTVTDPNGVVTQLDYTARGDLSAATIDPGGANPDVTSFAYDSAGQLVHHWRAVGTARAFDNTATYDAAHRPTRQTDLYGNKIDLTRDLLNNITEQTLKDSGDTLRVKAQTTYDSLGRLATQKNAAGTQVLSFGYDGNGNPTTVTAPQNSWTNAFDALNRLTSSVNASSNTVSFTRSPLDWVNQVTDPRSVATTYTVNGLGNVSSVGSPDRGTTTLSYDATGAVSSMTDAANRTTTVTRDVLGRPTLYTLHGGATIGFTYDTGTNQRGRVTQMTDASGSTSWAYDAKGRMTSKTQVAAGLTRTLTATYDAAGRVTQLVYPSGRVVTATYATQGAYSTTRPLSIAVTGVNVLTNITYAPGTGALSGWTYGNGQTMTRTFDTNGRVTNNGLGTLAYNTAGLLTSYTAGAESYTFTFDARNRLTAVTGSATQSYGYDANGNRTSHTVGGAARTFTIAAGSNRLTSATNPSRTFTYDATGALTTDGSRTFTYDALGRVSAGGGATYARNGAGQRVAKTASGATTVFFYDSAGHLLGEYSSSGTTIQEYVYLGDMPVAIVQPAATYYVKADELNTPRAVVNSAGTTVWSWARRPFGENAPTGSFTLNLRHPGQYFDTETGTFENHNRTYDPQLGRYLQSDPIGLGGGLNTYAYVENNPAQGVDPSGLFNPLGPTGIASLDNDPAVVIARAKWDNTIEAAQDAIVGAVVDGLTSAFGPDGIDISTRLDEGLIAGCTIKWGFGMTNSRGDEVNGRAGTLWAETTEFGAKFKARPPWYGEAYVINDWQGHVVGTTIAVGFGFSDLSKMLSSNPLMKDLGYQAQLAGKGNVSSICPMGEERCKTAIYSSLNGKFGAEKNPRILGAMGKPSIWINGYFGGIFSYPRPSW